MLANPEIRKWYLDQALKSFTSLNEVLGKLTEKEVFAALELESASTRRQSFIDRLISRAVHLNKLSYRRQLTEKFHGTHAIEDPDRTGAEGS